MSGGHPDSSDDHENSGARLAHQHRLQRQHDQFPRRWNQLDVHEQEILRLLADGHRAAAVAEHLEASMAAVRAHIRSILAKLEVDSQVDAVALVLDHRSRQPPPSDGPVRGAAAVDRPTERPADRGACPG